MKPRRALARESGARRRLRRRRPAPVVEGVARADRRTKNLLHRIAPGEIALIAHEDLDLVSAEGLVERDVAAVVNAHRSITGRYPNTGPLVLAHAGIPLIDEAGDEVLERVREGDTVRIVHGAIYLGADLVARGTVLDEQLVERRLVDAEAAIGAELERFVRNTTQYLSEERDLILHGAGMPAIETNIAGRPVVVVVRGHHYRQDLRALRAYIREMRPVLVAVDGAADTLIADGLRPDLINGDMDSVSPQALTCGAEIVVHAYPDGRAPGLERVEALGIEPKMFPSSGTSEDIALLLAYEKGADLIVAVGAHDNLVEFLDKGRGGMASTFIVRLKVGPKLVDAKGVNRLYRSQVRTRDMVILVASAMAAMVTVGLISPSVRLFLRSLF